MAPWLLGSVSDSGQPSLYLISLAERVSTLQFQSSGIRFALPPVVVDNSELGSTVNTPRSYKPIHMIHIENFSFRNVFTDFVLTCLLMRQTLSATGASVLRVCVCGTVCHRANYEQFKQHLKAFLFEC